MAADYYRELGVARTASSDEIKRAFRKLAGKHHPDRNPGDAEAEARFKAINRANEVLSDDTKRKLYDRYGEVGLREGFRPGGEGMGGGQGRSPYGGGGVGLEDLFGKGGAGIGDMFGEMFGGRSGRGGRAQQALKGADVAAELEVEFVTAIRGTSVEFSVPGETSTTTVRIPPGAGDGDKLRVAGQGGPGRFGGPTGDLLITIHVKSHPHFRRTGLDLTLDLPVTATEAYFGAKVPVPTPGGTVTLSVPAKSQSGQEVRLKGKGVTRRNRVGDLFVRFLVKLPDADGEAIETAVRTLGDATSESLRDGIEF